MRIYRIYFNRAGDYEDYEARTAREAIERYQKETGHYYYWEIRIIKR